MSTPSESTNRIQLQLLGTAYEGWEPILGLFDHETGKFDGAIVVAPKDSEALNPFVFFRPASDELAEVVIKNSSLFYLAIEVAHRWANTGDLDGLNEHTIGNILSVISFNHLDSYERGKTFESILTIFASDADILAKDKVEAEPEADDETPEVNEGS